VTGSIKSLKAARSPGYHHHKMPKEKDQPEISG